MPMHWVLIANASRAELYAAGPLLDPFAPVATLQHPESRARTADLVSDRRGHTWSGPGGGRTALDRHTDPQRATRETFAREVASALRDGRVGGAFERLVLVAPPAFLGMVRAELDTDTARRVVASVASDLTLLPVTELPARVRAAIPATAGLDG